MSTATVLTNAEIDDLCNWPAANTTMRAENDRDLARSVERAVIEKWGASDMVPVGFLPKGHIHRHLNGQENSAAWVYARQTAPDNDQLYDATALVQARQQGYEAARAEFGPNAERYQWLRGAGDETEVIVGLMYEVCLCNDDLDAAIDAARQSAHKEA